MRKTIFLDANVVMDIVFKREEFLPDVLPILASREEGFIDLYISALTLSHIAYFAKRFGRKPGETVSEVLKWMVAIDLRSSHFESAAISKFSDFEDAIQYFSACDVRGIDYIITRNVRDFKLSHIPALSPKQFVDHYL